MICEAGDHAGFDDFLAVIDVVQEHVQRADPLEQAGLQLAPLGSGQDAWNDIEGDQALGAGRAAIDREGDAQALEEQVGLLTLRLEGRAGGVPQPAGDAGIGCADPTVPAMHFIEKTVPRHRSYFTPSRL